MLGANSSFPTRKFPFILGTYIFGWSRGQGLGYQVTDQHLPVDNLTAMVRAGGHDRSNHPEQDDDGYLEKSPKITGPDDSM